MCLTQDKEHLKVCFSYRGARGISNKIKKIGWDKNDLEQKLASTIKYSKK